MVIWLHVCYLSLHDTTLTANRYTYNHIHILHSANYLPQSFLTKGDKKILENIKKKERKIQNMQEETRRIYLKENSQDGGLTDGQVVAVERNDKAVEQLMAEIDTLVSTLQSKNLQRQHRKGTDDACMYVYMYVYCR